MSGYTHREGNGSLFKNERKQQGDRTPDYRGDALVNGQLVEIAAWIKESSSGKKFLSLKFQEPRDRSAPRVESTPAPIPDTDVPF